MPFILMSWRIGEFIVYLNFIVLLLSGIYPVHGWKDKEGLVHMAEASSNDNGTVIEWGKAIGKSLKFTVFQP